MVRSTRQPTRLERAQSFINYINQRTEDVAPNLREPFRNMGIAIVSHYLTDDPRVKVQLMAEYGRNIGLLGDSVGLTFHTIISSGAYRWLEPTTREGRIVRRRPERI